jgi:hypothetical protein
LKKSHYFSDLSRSYSDEIDDLLTDSAGKSALQKRLNDKRQEFEAILPMIAFSPEMVAVTFHSAFSFSSPEIMQQIVQSNPDRSDFPDWEALKGTLTVADWAKPLIVSALKTRGGDSFLVVSAALEFLRAKDMPDATEHRPKADQALGDAAEEGEDDEADDLAEAGADWLNEQGFDPLER